MVLDQEGVLAPPRSDTNSCSPDDCCNECHIQKTSQDTCLDLVSDELAARVKTQTEEDDLHSRVQTLENQLAIMNENLHQLLAVTESPPLIQIKSGNISSFLDKSQLSVLRSEGVVVNNSNNRQMDSKTNQFIVKGTETVTTAEMIPHQESFAERIPKEVKNLSVVSNDKGNRTAVEDKKKKTKTVELDEKKTSIITSKKQNLKSNRVISLFQSLNLDSFRQDGSASEEVDANMEEFVRVPFKLEGLMFLGFTICVDSFLHILTVVPLKIAWSFICLMCTMIRPMKGIEGCRFHRRHLYQLIRAFIIFAIYRYCLCLISVGKLYHWIRGQEMLKLYVLMAMVEVFDRLMCSLGQDALDSLYWNITRRPYHPRMIISTIVVLFYAVTHSLILLIHVATLNVAMNSADQALLSLLIGGNFAEIKSTVFKKYNEVILFKITSSDICERFKLLFFLGLVLLLNCSQGGMNQDMVNDYVKISCIIMSAELICDWIKHSFITKLNSIKSSVYDEYALILARDITGVGHEGVNIDPTHAVVKRLGFAQIPLFCVMARYLTEAVRYAEILSDAGDSNHVLYSIAVLYTRGSWSLVTSSMFSVFLLLLVLKILLGQAVTTASRKILSRLSDGKDKLISAKKSAKVSDTIGRKLSL